MKFSIITVSYNSGLSIQQTIDSVLSQKDADVEYIIIDGASSDGTIEMIKSFKNKITKFVSEPDHGIYDAMNKGIELATGDVVGFLNSDDFYKNEYVLKSVENTFFENNVDCVIGDVEIVNNNDLNKVIRLYRSPLKPVKLFKYGIMPPHPAFFAKRAIYEKLGLFRTDYKIAADFELVIRFLYKYNLSYCNLSNILITMRNGGVSNANFNSKRIITNEIIKACKENNLRTNKLLLLLRFPYKIMQMIFINRR